MGPEAPLAINESALQPRACLPCPEGVVCSRLAVVNPPHQLPGGSVFPVDAAPGSKSSSSGGGGPLARSLFVYAAALLPCLHSGVCNTPPAYGPVDTWEDWLAVQAAGLTDAPAFSRFRCRDGHDDTSLLCSKCQPGYYTDGFLCARCREGFGALVVIVGLVALAALAVYLWYRSAEKKRSEGSGSSEETEGDNTVSLLLYFLQVATVLKTSEQVLERGSCRARA